MSPPRNYDELRRTAEQVEAERRRSAETPIRPTDRAAMADHQPSAELSQVTIEVRRTSEQERTEYIQSLRDKKGRSPHDIDHTERKMENLELVDHNAKRQAAEKAEERAREQPSEDFFPQRDKGDRAFAVLRGGEITYFKPQPTEQLPSSRGEVSPENEKDERIARLLEDHHDKRKRDEQLASSSRDSSDRQDRYGSRDMELTETQRQRLDRMHNSGSNNREHSADREDGAPDSSRDDQGGGHGRDG